MNLGFRHNVQWLKRTRGNAAALTLLLALASVPRLAHAQDMSFNLDEAESGGGEAKGDAKGGKDKAAKGKADKAEKSDDSSGDSGSAASGGGGDVLSELAAGGSKDEATGEDNLPREKEIAEKIYAVQRMYVLRNGRFELIPSIAFTVNDPYVSHPALSGGLNYWVTNVLAVGANFLWYQGLESESKLDFSVRRSTRLAVPITEYQMGGHLNFTYVPVYGKFEMFNDSIFQWDAYLIGGVGLLRTRPVAVVDPAVRSFDFDWRVAFNVGIGLRVFITKWLSAFGELRDYMYLEKLENLQVSLSDREGRNTWIDPNATLTNNVTAHLGLTMFFPFTFEYRYPK
jgi:outer membrane beta-barrel protein